MCRRGGADGWRERTDRHGVPYWLSPPPDGARPLRIAPAPVRPERASAEELSRVYGDLLSRLSLHGAHRDELIDRAPAVMSEELLARHGFRSWPATGRARLRLAALLWDVHGDLCHRVPGWYLCDGRGPRLAGGPGWVLPCWDLSGRVTALRIRSDGDTGPRYYWLSSARHGGPGPELTARLAWPRRRPSPSCRAETVRITEGEVKSIVAAEATGIPTLSVPGVDLWRLALPWIERLQARTVLLAWDADQTTRPQVARTLLQARRELSARGIAAHLETWRI